MNSGCFRRGMIALVAAYAMALQALFAASVPPAPAVPAGSSALACSQDADGFGQPAHHDLPCAALCAALRQDAAGPAPPGVVAAIAEPRAAAAVGPVHAWVLPRIALTTVHAPRGPPLA